MYDELVKIAIKISQFCLFGSKIYFIAISLESDFIDQFNLMKNKVKFSNNAESTS